MRKIKQGDTVQVIAGQEKGASGKVLKVIAKITPSGVQTFYLVEGVRKVIRHTKPNPQLGRQGGRLSSERPIHGSNVSLVDAKSRPSRVGIKQREDGQKVRFLKRTGEVVND